MSKVMTNSKPKQNLRFIDRIFQKLVDRMAPADLRGCLKVSLPRGHALEFGHAATGPQADLRLHDYSVVWAALRRGSLGFAESYMSGRVETSDLKGLFDFFMANMETLEAAGGKLFKARMPDRIWHMLRDNNRKGAKKNIEAHYDLGNDFYELWLDPSMTYSSAIFSADTQDLAAAQAEKYAAVLKATQVKPGGRILEIGCGWGGFAEVAAQQKIHVHGLTLSREQLAYAQDRLSKAGLAEFAHLELRDYRDSDGQFDGIASIEMIEAVGERHWPNYFRTVAQRLKPGGRAAIQAITLAEVYFDIYRRKVDFIQRYIFPGGMLLTKEIIQKQAEAQGLRVVEQNCFNLSYARTLKIWRENFEAAWPEIAKLGFDERFRRMWRYYLAYCEVGFENSTIDVGIYTLEKPA
jgi:cyclopropane-fatty-acyl-phospholipid synthase